MNYESKFSFLINNYHTLRDIKSMIFDTHILIGLIKHTFWYSSYVSKPPHFEGGWGVVLTNGRKHMRHTDTLDFSVFSCAAYCSPREQNSLRSDSAPAGNAMLGKHRKIVDVSVCRICFLPVNLKRKGLYICCSSFFYNCA